MAMREGRYVTNILLLTTKAVMEQNCVSSPVIDKGIRADAHQL
jgi:hypothetical protein